MATLSELTIHQSDALKLQQEKNMKDVELQQCYARMEQVCLICFIRMFYIDFCYIRENLPLKNWNLNGNVRMNLNKNVKLNEEFEKKFDTVY